VAGDPRWATVAPLAVRALQRWYGADPFALNAGLYSYDDPSLDIRWRDWRNPSQIRRNVSNIVTAVRGRRNRVQDVGRWWESANAITAVIDYMSVTGDRSYLKPVVENSFARVPGVHRPIETRISESQLFSARDRASYTGFLNAYYDDEGWWALTWIAAYDLTGDETYLAAASHIFSDMTDAWDNVLGGGIYWGKYNGQPDRGGIVAVPPRWKGPYKNAIANELFITAAAALGRRYRRRGLPSAGLPDYLGWARRGWEWFSSPPPDGIAMINGDNLINDSPDSHGVNNNTESVWSYNQGVILTGLSDLTELTGDPAYIASAEKLADCFIKHPWHVETRSDSQLTPITPNQSGVIDGILHEYNECNADGTGPDAADAVPGIGTTLFKGIFVRNLARLQAATGKASYRQFILTNARSAVSHMNARHQFGCNWAAPVDTPDFVRQTAGIDLVNAALLVSESGT
jgi:predicted alpha-1,6-mannanase (GH76 family)